MLKNSDPIGHNSNFTPFVNPAQPVIPASGKQPIDGSRRKKGVPVKVGCNIHPWMRPI